MKEKKRGEVKVGHEKLARHHHKHHWVRKCWCTFRAAATRVLIQRPGKCRETQAREQCPELTIHLLGGRQPLTMNKGLGRGEEGDGEQWLHVHEWKQHFGGFGARQ